MKEYREIKRIINEVQDNIRDLFFSGFNSPHEVTVREFLRLSTILESVGMKYGALKLKNIVNEFNKKRHSFDFNYARLTHEYCELNEYLSIISQKLQLMILKQKIT
ncbi:hypothetical protein [Clostridium felsineum]|uniref:hypothetical protein n=1 Tax=Clostridium felsineum TaxID=36839 RepID=UPI00098CD709|nr:hypothetical protein [Clostridium felsineum]URZ16532.1 hypothetical protein CLFE_025790 [Clostridium felsineum DSM 794]